MALDPTKCPLMTPSLIQGFEALHALLERLKSASPRLNDYVAPDDPIADDVSLNGARLHRHGDDDRLDLPTLDRRMGRLRRLMERERYLVGFLGRSQVGKSTTLNRVLRPVKGEEPATGGAGAPATSTATRLYIKTPEQAAANPGKKHLLTLHYMTPEQFRKRREILGDYLGYPAEMSDAEILKDIDRMLGSKNVEGSRDNDLKKEDRRYFARLLRGYAHFGATYLKNPHRVEAGDFAKRADYTNHPEDGVARPYPLLSEVEIAYEKGDIDRKIELIDLPGLGARLASDDLLTKAFLPELSGALIFQSVEQVAAREAYELLHLLRSQYSRLTGRVWMVITKFDTMSDEHFGLGRSSSIFDEIRKTMDENRIPLGQVLLVANEFHKELLDENGVPREPTADDLLRRLKLKQGLDGKPEFPAAIRNHTELSAAFAHVAHDGGIERIKEVIGRVLAQEVETEVRADVAAQLESIRKGLLRLAKTTREIASNEDDQDGKTGQWRLKLQTLIRKIDHDPNQDLIEGPGEALVTALFKVLTNDTPEGLEIRPEQMRASHTKSARLLKNQALFQGKSETLPKIFGEVSRLLRSAQEEFGPIRLTSYDSPLQAWDGFQEEKLISPDWFVAAVAKFESPPPFPGGAKVPTIDSDRYREILEQKIRIVVQAAISETGEVVKEKLRSIEEEMFSNSSIPRETDAQIVDLLNTIISDSEALAFA